jgi:hypothetical protein
MFYRKKLKQLELRILALENPAKYKTGDNVVFNAGFHGMGTSYNGMIVNDPVLKLSGWSYDILVLYHIHKNIMECAIEGKLGQNK